jgi:hypothetical protein
MNENSNPLDYLIQCCETAINTGHWNLTRFTVLNAKNELEKLRETKRDLTQDVFNANKNSVDDNNRWLSCEKELVALKEKIKTIFSQPVAYGLINDRHDLYNLTLHYNRFDDKDDKLIPLYSNREEFLQKDWQNGKLSK